MARKIAGPSQPTPEEAPATPEAPPVARGGVSMQDLGIMDGVAQSELPRLEGRPARMMMVHPERWTVLAGQVVPVPGWLPLVGGVANVRTTGRGGGISISSALAIQHKRGWVEVPLDIDGPETSYLHSPCPGVYLTRWETAHAGSSRITPDGEGFAAWIRGHIDAGRLPAPKPYVLEGLAAELRGQRLQLQDKVRTVPSAQVELDRVIADLKVVEQELASQKLIPAQTKSVALDDLVQE